MAQDGPQIMKRAQCGIFKPKLPYVGLLRQVGHEILSPSSISSFSSFTKPSSISKALQSSNWKNTMVEEFNTLQVKKTWRLVSHDGSQKVDDSKWVFETKLNVNGSLLKHKDRLVVKGFQQSSGVDYGEIFSSVVKLTTIRVALSLAETLK